MADKKAGDTVEVVKGRIETEAARRLLSVLRFTSDVSRDTEVL